MRSSLAVVPRKSPGPKPTRDRVLDAAERLFTERGFKATSVRDITAAAGCNIAAVNYHFNGKVGLYREMYRRRLAALREQRIEATRRAMAGAGDRASLELVLRSFTEAFLEPHQNQSDGRRLVKLFALELLDPHLKAGTLHREMVIPVQRSLIRAIRTFCPGGDERAERRAVHSIVAQLVHVVQMRSLPGAGRGADGTDFALEAVVDHIVRFSAAGMRATLRAKGARGAGAGRTP